MFIRFMAGSTGRWIRGVAGIALIAAGFAMKSTTGTVVGVVGLLPLAAAVFDWYIFAPLFGKSIRGCNIRQA